MKRFFQSEVGAAVMWVIGSVVLAAVISPWVYQAGKQLAAAAEAKSLPGVLEWLGHACDRARFSRYFDRSLLVSALLLMPAAMGRIRRLRADADGVAGAALQPVGGSSAAVQLAVGCILAGGLLTLLGKFLLVSGAYVMKTDPPTGGSLISQILIPAVAASLLEEWVFRGLLLGLWLRFAKPFSACLGTSVLFAFLHFLKPPGGMSITEPVQALAGFELLGKILLHFTDPLFFVTDFATLLVAGMILAWARLRTGALWFSIGLHAGWIMALKGCSMFYQHVADHPLRPWGVGSNLRSGVLPLLTLGLTALACGYALKWIGDKKTTFRSKRLD